MSIQKQHTAFFLASFSILATAVVFCYVAPISQDLHYHCFANEKTIASIPNFWNVMSNIGFVFSGAWGFIVMKQHKINSPMIVALCIGMMLTGFGSAYYHYQPNNTTLVWDRLPMTIVFTAFFAQMYAWYFNSKTAIIVWLGALFIGLFSVWYWQYTEQLACGDLRLYALVQFLPIILIFIIVCVYNKENVPIHTPLFIIFVSYLIAKVLEHFDAAIFDASTLASGHPLKHVAASIATASMVWMIKRYYKNKK
jgi:hypothetical protein